MLKYYKGDSRSVGNSTCPQELSPAQAPNKLGDTLWGTCHTGWSPLLADTLHSSPDDLSHSHHHPHLLALRKTERVERGHTEDLIIYEKYKHRNGTCQCSTVDKRNRKCHLFSFSLLADLACSFLPGQSCLSAPRSCEHSSSPAQSHHRPHLHSTQNT